MLAITLRLCELLLLVNCLFGFAICLIVYAGLGLLLLVLCVVITLFGLDLRSAGLVWVVCFWCSFVDVFQVSVSLLSRFCFACLFVCFISGLLTC